MTENTTIFQFINAALNISGSAHNVINNELIMAQCQVEVPRSFFRPAHTEVLNLQMVCAPELVTKYPGSELVSKGSFRLQWLIEGIRQRGLITKGTVLYDLDPRKTQREISALLDETPKFFFAHPLLIYQPHLLVNFKVGLETDEKLEELYHLSINLVNGEISSNLLVELQAKKISPHSPAKGMEKKRIPYSEGYHALFNHLKWLLQNHDPRWLTGAESRWKEEVGYLEAFYRGNTDTDDEAGFYRRLAEVYRKFRPVIRIHINNIGLVYLPLIIYTRDPYPDQAELNPLLYDPVRRKVRVASANPNHQNDTK